MSADFALGVAVVWMISGTINAAMAVRVVEEFGDPAAPGFVIFMFLLGPFVGALEYFE